MIKISKHELVLDVDNDVNLVALTVAHVSDTYVSWMNDYEVVKYTEQKYVHHDTNSVRRFVQEKYDSANEYLFGIFYKGTHVGNIKIGPINNHHRISDISYFIGDKNYLSLGIGTRSIKRIVQFGFDELELDKICAACFSINEGSKKVLLNAGFNLEGIRLKHGIFEGERIDVLMFGVLRPGFE